MNVLISLHKGYGLGDAVQMSAVLRHVVKYRPEWKINYQATEGQHQVGRGIVEYHFAYGKPYPSPHYDAEVQILLFDTWANWGDRPNTRVSSCLHERFGLPWDPECGRYQVNISQEARKVASAFFGADSFASLSAKTNFVGLHYIGDSSPSKKNLTNEQAIDICTEIERLGYTPLLLDWKNKSPLTSTYGVQSVGWSPHTMNWGANAEVNCAVISRCAAFIGIDSGPSKCASATDTPALVIWTGHHPAPFHDPAPNTTHLCPKGYHGLDPVCSDQGVIDWFEKHYNVLHYQRNPVPMVRLWLEEVLANGKPGARATHKNTYQAQANRHYR